MVVGLGELQHVDEVPALRVDVGVGPAELEARRLQQGKQIRQRLAAVGYGLELAGVLAIRVVGHDHLGARVLDVPAGELGLERGDVVAADALEDVRVDLAGCDVRLQVTGGRAETRVTVASGRRESGPGDLFVQIFERGRISDIGRARRLAAGRRSGRRARARSRTGRTAAASRGQRRARYGEQSDERRSVPGEERDHSQNIATDSCVAQATRT